MNKNIFLFFIFISSYLFSQEKFNVVVEYRLSMSQQDLKAYLVSNEDKSYFIISNKLEQDYNGFLNDNNRNINPYYLYHYQKNDNKFYQTLSYFSAMNLGTSIDKMSEDQIGDIKWNLENKEKKSILGYECRKASCDYRGRKYVVWFTTQITNYSFPWKFKGLPGAILAFEDSEGFFKGEAEKLSLNKQYSVPDKIVNFFSNKSNQIYKYQEAIKFENDYLEEFRQQRIASSPKGGTYITTPIRELCLEKSFEWEDSEKR